MAVIEMVMSSLYLIAQFQIPSLGGNLNDGTFPFPSCPSLRLLPITKRDDEGRVFPA